MGLDFRNGVNAVMLLRDSKALAGWHYTAHLPPERGGGLLTCQASSIAGVLTSSQYQPGVTGDGVNLPGSAEKLARLMAVELFQEHDIPDAVRRGGVEMAADARAVVVD